MLNVDQISLIQINCQINDSSFQKNLKKHYDKTSEQQRTAPFPNIVVVLGDLWPYVVVSLGLKPLPCVAIRWWNVIVVLVTQQLLRFANLRVGCLSGGIAPETVCVVYTRCHLWWYISGSAVLKGIFWLGDVDRFRVVALRWRYDVVGTIIMVIWGSVDCARRREVVGAEFLPGLAAEEGGVVVPPFLDEIVDQLSGKDLSIVYLEVYLRQLYLE